MPVVAKHNLPAYFMIAVLAIATSIVFVLYLQSSQDNGALKAELSAARGSLLDSQKQHNLTLADLDAKNRDVQRQQDEIANLTSALRNSTGRIRDLNERLNESEEELEDARNTLSEAEEEIGKIRADALEMDEQINESIQWFKDNSMLPSTLKADRFISKVEKGCENDGVLNLACVSYLMEDELGFSYKNDPAGDRLYSIEEIISRKGGDCEDYSLFFKALLNELKGEHLEIEAWTGGIGKYVVYEDSGSGRYWYFENARGTAIGNTETSGPYAVCYFQGFSDDTRIGHCVIMLSGKTIGSPEDISDASLMGAPLFEPQDGRYLGKIGSEFFACSNGDMFCDTEENRLTFVITGDDLFQFSEGEWSYYHGRRNEIGNLLESLSDIELG